MKLYSVKFWGTDGQIDFKNVEAADLEAAKKRMQEILPAGATVEKILQLPDEDEVDETPRYRLGEAPTFLTRPH